VPFGRLFRSRESNRTEPQSARRCLARHVAQPFFTHDARGTGAKPAAGGRPCLPPPLPGAAVRAVRRSDVGVARPSGAAPAFEARSRCGRRRCCTGIGAWSRALDVEDAVVIGHELRSNICSTIEYSRAAATACSTSTFATQAVPRERVAPNRLDLDVAAGATVLRRQRGVASVRLIRGSSAQPLS
jgi:hypothetical protein